MSKTFSTIISEVREKEIDSLIGMGLILEDAEDVFQEASVALYDVMSSQRLTMKSTPQAYLHGICHNMAYKKLAELSRKIDLVDDEKLNRLLSLTEEGDKPLPDVVDDESNEIDYCSILSILLEKLTPRDFSIIHGFYIEGKSMETLAIENNMASVEVARTTKCRILNRLKEQAINLLRNYY